MEYDNGMMGWDFFKHLLDVSVETWGSENLILNTKKHQKQSAPLTLISKSFWFPIFNLTVAVFKASEKIPNLVTRMIHNNDRHYSLVPLGPHTYQQYIVHQTMINLPLKINRLRLNMIPSFQKQDLLDLKQ